MKVTGLGSGEESGYGWLLERRARVSLQLTLLGGFQARLSRGLILNLRLRKAQALLAYLGLRPGQAHPRDKLAALLWGESREDQARDALRHALVALRQVLPVTDPPILLVEGQT